MVTDTGAPPPRPRVVLDTNVLLSGVFFGGLPARILAGWQSGQLDMLLSPAILGEYRSAGAALAARYPTVDAPLDAVLARVAQEATSIDAPDLPEPVSADPDDDKFLACALVAAAVVVSGDTHLRRVSGWRGVEVLTPRQFADRYPGAVPQMPR